MVLYGQFDAHFVRSAVAILATTQAKLNTACYCSLSCCCGCCGLCFFIPLTLQEAGIDSWVRPPLASSEAVMGLLHRKFTTIQWELQQFDKNK